MRACGGGAPWAWGAGLESFEGGSPLLGLRVGAAAEFLARALGRTVVDVSHPREALEAGRHTVCTLQPCATRPLSQPGLLLRTCHALEGAGRSGSAQSGYHDLAHEAPWLPSASSTLLGAERSLGTVFHTALMTGSQPVTGSWSFGGHSGSVG